MMMLRKRRDAPPPSGGGAAPAERWRFRIYTVGVNPAAETALRNLRAICSKHLELEPTIEVVDLEQEPELALSHGIYAVPTVIRHHPLPLMKVIGDLSDRRRTLDGLAIGPR